MHCTSIAAFLKLRNASSYFSIEHWRSCWVDCQRMREIIIPKITKTCNNSRSKKRRSSSINKNGCLISMTILKIQVPSMKNDNRPNTKIHLLYQIEIGWVGLGFGKKQVHSMKNDWIADQNTKIKFMYLIEIGWVWIAWVALC